MRVQITERHCAVPSEVLKRTEEQMASFSKYSPRASAVDVVYMEEKLTKVVEVIVHIDGDEPVVARGEGMEFRSSLDQVVDRVSRILRKRRERQIDHQAPARGGRAGQG